MVHVRLCCRVVYLTLYLSMPGKSNGPFPSGGVRRDREHLCIVKILLVIMKSKVSKIYHFSITGSWPSSKYMKQTQQTGRIIEEKIS